MNTTSNNETCTSTHPGAAARESSIRRRSSLDLGEALLAEVPARTVAFAVSPLDADHLVDGILSEANSVLNLVLNTLEEFTNERPEVGDAQAVLVALQFRLQLAKKIHDNQVPAWSMRGAAWPRNDVQAERATAARNDAASASMHPDAHEQAVAREMARTLGADLGDLRARVMKGPDSLAEERRAEAICSDLDRFRRLALSVADRLAPFDNARDDEPTHDAEE